MYRVYLFVERLPALLTALDRIENGAALEPLAERIRALLSEDTLGKYKELVEAVIDLDLAPREFLVRAQHDKSGELEQAHIVRPFLLF